MANPLVLAEAILQVGTQGISEAGNELLSLQNQLAYVKKEYAAGAVGMDEYMRETAKLNGQVRELTAGLNVAQSAVRKHGSEQAALNDVSKKLQESTNGMKTGFGGAAMTMMAFGHAIDDVQYGFHSIVNNIPQLVTGIGSLAGLTPATSILVGSIAQIGGVIIDQAIPYIKDMAKEFGFMQEDAKVGIEGLKDRIKELKDMKIRLPVDDFELKQAEARLKSIKEDEQALEKLRKLRSTHQEEASKQTKSAIAETGRSEEIENKMASEMTKIIFEENRKKLADDIAKKEAELAKARETMEIHNPYNTKEGSDAYARTREIPEEIKKLNQDFTASIGSTRDAADQRVAHLFKELTEGTNPAGVERARRQYAGLLRRAGEGELAEKIVDITPAKVKTKAEQAQAKHKQQEADREKKEKDRTEAGTLHEKFENFSMGKDALEKLARETYEAKQQNGRTDQQVFEELKQKLEVMLKGVGIFTDKQVADNEEARKLVTREINALAKQVDAQGNQLANKAKQEQKEDLALPLMARIQGGNVPEVMRETYKGHIAAGLDPQAALKQTVEAQANEINNDLLIPDGKDTPAAREQVMHALMPIGKQIVGQVKGEEAAAKKKAAGRAEREDAKDDKKEFQTSTQALSTDLGVEEMLSRYKYESEQRKSYGKKGLSDEEIKNRIIGEIKTWLHRRIDNNGRQFDPNPRMGAEATDATAKAIFESGEDKFRNDFLSLGRQNLSGIDRLVAINRSSLDMLNELQFKAGIQGNDLSQLETKVQGMQLNQQHGRRGSAKKGGK